jgi:hypothetical protein
LDDRWSDIGVWLAAAAGVLWVALGLAYTISLVRGAARERRRGSGKGDGARHLK